MLFIKHQDIGKRYFKQSLQQPFEVGTFIILLNLKVDEGEVLN